MAKQTSLFGKVSGKIGSVVFSTSGGQTISREYNPNVANPNTIAQVNQRARMKLMSQLSSALSPVIAMTKDGLVSKRNKFTKINFPASYALNGTAQITYENLQITEGNTSFPALTAQGEQNIETGDYEIIASLSVAPSATINRVVYCLFRKTDEGKLEYVTSSIVTNANALGRIYGVELPWQNGQEYVLFAYGMSDTSERATAQYGNLNVVSASDLARLVATRAISYQDYQFTQTRAITIAGDGTAVQPSESGRVRIYATPLGQGGTVTGAGTFDVGASVTLTATPSQGYTFRAWLKNGTNEVLSSANPWTFEAATQIDAVAAFDVDTGGGL